MKRIRSSQQLETLRGGHDRHATRSLLRVMAQVSRDEHGLCRGGDLEEREVIRVGQVCRERKGRDGVPQGLHVRKDLRNRRRGERELRTPENLLVLLEDSPVHAHPCDAVQHEIQEAPAWSWRVQEPGDEDVRVEDDPHRLPRRARRVSATMVSISSMVSRSRPFALAWVRSRSTATLARARRMA